MATLRRIVPDDGKGDSGAYSQSIRILNEYVPYFGAETVNEGERPVVGCIMRVGSMSARSYSSQDYWQTSVITQILEDTPEKVVFRTSNSTYEWTP